MSRWLTATQVPRVRPPSSVCSVPAGRAVLGYAVPGPRLRVRERLGRAARKSPTGWKSRSRTRRPSRTGRPGTIPASRAWLGVAGKASGIASATDGEPVDVGLCRGWISVTAPRPPAPRPPRPVLLRAVPVVQWSRVGVEKVAALAPAGRMREPGLPRSGGPGRTAAGTARTRARRRPSSPTTSPRRSPRTRRRARRSTCSTGPPVPSCCSRCCGPRRRRRGGHGWSGAVRELAESGRLGPPAP